MRCIVDFILFADLSEVGYLQLYRTRLASSAFHDRQLHMTRKLINLHIEMIFFCEVNKVESNQSDPAGIGISNSNVIEHERELQGIWAKAYANSSIFEGLLCLLKLRSA